MVIGIDGAFVKAGRTRAGQRHQFEILTGRVEASQRERGGIRRGAGSGSVCKEAGASDFCGAAAIVWIGSMLHDGSQRKSAEIVLDFDATDDLFHGSQEGAFFNGYYRQYCYLPLQLFLR
jgi:Transposase DDE domain group 1